MPIRVSDEDISRFAQWSADCNPLHVDETFARQTHFGGRIAHGMLSVLETFHAAEVAADERLDSLDIEFRGAVVTGASYEAQAERAGDTLTLTLVPAHAQRENDRQPVLVARTGRADTSATVPSPDPSWVKSAASRGPRASAAPRSLEDFERGIEITGYYPASVEPWAVSGVTPLQARVLALCSYAVGMEAPGLQSLFTRLSVRFHIGDHHATVDLVYRLRSVRFDRTFRLLDTELEVASPTGQLLATAAIRAYVPFSPSSTDPAALADMLGTDAALLDGKVVLVVGGTQGLGAEIAASAALARSHVYVSGRHDDASRAQLHESLIARGASIVFVQGDAADPAWCQTTLEQIRARHGRLDALVLNACGRPEVTRLDSPTAYPTTYIADNVRLIETPLAAFTELLHQNGGTIAYISSTYVDQPRAGFGPYVAVKMAGEALVRAICRESSRLSAVIVRPPELQTRWNDTPAAAHGSIPPARAAIHIVRALATSRDGEVSVLTEFPPIATSALATAPEFTLRLAASFTSDPMLPAVRFWLKELQLNAAVETAPYGQILQSLLDPSGGLNARGRGFNVVLLRVSDWLRELSDEQAGNLEYATTHFQRTARDLEGAIRAHRQQSSAGTLLLLCPSDPDLSPLFSALVQDTESHLAAALNGMPGLEIARAADYHAAYRVADHEIHDALRDEIGHIPFHDEYFFTLATIAVRHAYRAVATLRKVVVVDCDNTLVARRRRRGGSGRCRVRRGTPRAAPDADTPGARRRARVPVQQERGARRLARVRHA